MYSSIMNSYTFNLEHPDIQTYCSFYPDVGSIGKDVDLFPFLSQYMAEYDSDFAVLVNPPFTEMMIRRAIKNVLLIVNHP